MVSAYGRPTQGAYRRFDDLNTDLTTHLEALQQILDADVAQFNQTLKERGATAVMVPKY